MKKLSVTDVFFLLLFYAGKKLRNGLKYSHVTELPDTLCIHLKRFRHDFSFSTKINTKVTFPLVNLDMEQWLHKDAVSKVSIEPQAAVNKQRWGCCL